MAEYAERSPARVASPPETAEQAGTESKIHPRQLIHGAICILAFALYSWPGALFAGSVEPRILGFPFYVFWVLILIPLIQFINLLVYARYMIARERALKQQPNREIWE